MRRGVVGAVAVVGLVAAIGGAWWLRGGFAARPRLVPLERTPPPAGPRAEPRVDGAPLVADAPLDAPLDAETAAQRTETRGPRATVVRHGRVVAADSGIELADALIRLPTGAPGGLLRDGLFSLQRGHELARSDANGRFAASVALDDWLVVAADGYAPRAVAAMELGESIGGAPTFALERPARLRATVVAVDGAPAAGVTVRLLERRGATRFVVEAISDAAGVALLEAVPPDCELVVELTEGMALLERESVTMRFAAGALQTRRFALRAAVLVSGRVIDQDGFPVEGATIDLVQSLPLAAGAAAVERAVEERAAIYGAPRWFANGISTDADGRFVTSHPPGFAIFGVEAAVNAQHEEEAYGTCCAAVEVREGARSATLSLLVERGLVVAGRMVGPQGEPVVGTVATSFLAEDGSYQATSQVRTDDDGRFRFPATSRRNALALTGSSRDGALASERPLLVHGGEGEVVVRVGLCQRFVIRAKPGAGTKDRLIEARLFDSDGREWDAPATARWQSLDAGFALQCSPFPAGRWDVLVIGHSSGQYVAEVGVVIDGRRAVRWVRGVEVASAGTTWLEVELQPAASLEFVPSEAAAGDSIRPTATTIGARVLVDGRLFFKGRLFGPHRDVIGGKLGEPLLLPPGPVTLEWIVAGRKTTEQLTLIAGETRRAAPPQWE